MAVKKFKPVTPGTRHKIIGTFDEITTNKPEKSLLSPQKNSGGRNNSGKMTVRYIGGGNKQMYRNIDFKRTKDGIPDVDLSAIRQQISEEVQRIYEDDQNS